MTPTQSHADRLADAAAVTAAARFHVDDHARLAAEVADLKLRAAGGDLDDQGAAELLRKAEGLRLAEITLPRRNRALADALAAEVAVGLEVLAALSDALDPVEAEAATAADKLTESLIDPAAAALDGDTVLARDLGVGRCSVEKAMPGVYRASLLRDRIKTASTTTWGAGHVPGEAAAIVATFDAELAAIRSGIAILKVAHKAAMKARD